MHWNPQTLMVSDLWLKLKTPVRGNFRRIYGFQKISAG